LAGCWGEKYLFLSKMMFFVSDIGFSIRSATQRRMRRIARRLARRRNGKGDEKQDQLVSASQKYIPKCIFQC